MESFISLLFCFYVYAFFITTTEGLSGHVCTRERSENYITSYNQAFLCQERYTTSCGQLDWRRCTRYRVQTCYTPKQRYAVRYHQVEECCSGWREDGAGQCTVPVCSRECQNGGSCVAVGSMPACLCQEGYSGDTCQHARNEWQLWQTVLLVGGAIAVVIIVGVIVVIVMNCRKTSGYVRLPQQEIAFRLPSDISTFTTALTAPSRPSTNVTNTHPSAPPPESEPPDG